jgi:hypothetical protein
VLDEDGEELESEYSWPADHFIVATNGGGDYWFIYQDHPARGIWRYWCESHEIQWQYASFDDYLGELRRYVRDPGKWRRLQD